MSLKSCWEQFLDDLSCAVLSILKNFLIMLVTLITSLLLKKLLDVTNLVDSKLLLARTQLKMLEAIYGSILSTLGILGEYIKQYDYCTDVGGIMTGAKKVLEEKASPYFKAIRKVREYLMLGKLKQLEITELQNLKSKLLEMTDSISSKIKEKCQ